MALMLAASLAVGGTDNVHLTYHWHLHQPIYWPEKHPGLNRYQYARDSIDLKLSNTGNFYPGSAYKHPRNNLVNGDGGEFDAVFDKADRVNAYQYGGKNSIETLLGHADGGASISYSGALQENVRSLGQAGSYGYGLDWHLGYMTARGWQTSCGYPRADMLGMTYHHAFGPLLPESLLRKEIEIFKEIWWKNWGGSSDKSDHSRGFWPVEAAFSETMIPVLVEQGYEWVIVANSHLARTCPNYMDVANRGTGGWNIDPPNRADQLGPWVDQSHWYSGTRDARGGTFPAPFAYQAHKAKYVNPETGAESMITVVPMCDYLSYENGYGSMGTGVMDGEIAPFADDPGHPCIVVMAHDGDNAWGGGSSYYMESVPNLMNEAAGKGYHPTTIQQFLSSNPVPVNDIVHVEDGAWVNAASDWGHPQFINWLWPPARDQADPGYDYDDPRTWQNVTNGWAEDWRNWAVIIAAANYCETAEKITQGNGHSVSAWKIQEPYRTDGTYNFPNYAEQAWHFMLGGLDSGFMYYGISLDDEVKQTLACNRAIALAQQAISDNPGGVADTTPPTVFKPQRYPWNPGGMGWGPLTGYRPVGFDGNPPHHSDFHVWTLVYDCAGVTNVTLYVREDHDGVNPLNSNANEVYAGSGEVGDWQAIPMQARDPVLGPSEGDNGDTLSFFMTPDRLATHYWAEVKGRRDKLADYYVRAIDSLGNVHRSVIQHVYIGDDGSPADRVVFSDDPRDCAPLGVTYDAAGGPLEGLGPLYQQISFDGGTVWSNLPMHALTGQRWVVTNMVPDNAPSATVKFNDGAIGDDNGGANWATAIRDCEAPFGPSFVEFVPANPTGCVDVTILYHPNDGVLRHASQVFIHIGHDGWQDLVVPAPAMTAGPGTSGWSYVYTPPAGVRVIQCAFNDGGTTWDNNSATNWSVTVTGCDPVPVLLAGGSPVISPDPVTQNGTNDAFDFVMTGYAAGLDQGGFGSFGRVYMNYDADHLYVGGVGCDMAGDNNCMVIFLGLNTRSDDVDNLWHLSGSPAGLDLLHNVVFDHPMDIAIVLGDEWGDGTYSNFSLGSGYDFGQGVYYLAESSNRFVEVSGARISQFDGAGTAVTGAIDYDGDRLVNRWEVGIPWASLGASGIEVITDCRLSGLIASAGVDGNDRYISGNYLGVSAAGTLQGGNFGFNLVDLTAIEVQLPGYDSDSDGLADEWELRFFVNLGFLTGDGDWDSDGMTDAAERYAGTDPTDAQSALKISSISELTATNGMIVRWRGVEGIRYGVLRSTNQLKSFEVWSPVVDGVSGENSCTDSLDSAGAVFYRIQVD